MEAKKDIPLAQLAKAPFLLFFPEPGSDPHQEIIESISTVDQSALLVWCARLNLLRSICGDLRDEFDSLLSPYFFSGEQIRRMRAVLKRAGRPRGVFLSCFQRPDLLELFRLAAMLGDDRDTEQSELMLSDPMVLMRASYCARMAAFERIAKAQSGPALDKERTTETEASYSLPIFAQMFQMQEGFLRKDAQVLGRSAMLLCDAFFSSNPLWLSRFESLVGMSLDEWLGCVMLAERLTTGDLAPDPRHAMQDFGILDIATAKDIPPRARSRLEAFLALETQNVEALRERLLERQTDKVVSKDTPFDTTPLRARPFVRTKRGSVVLSDRIFLQDKLWLGPVFRLLADGVPASKLFASFGAAIESYVIRLLRSAATRAGDAKRIVVANPKAGQSEITDICIREGPILVMIESKTAWLPEKAQWEYGDAAFVTAIRDRLASYGKPNKGIGQLARSIVGVVERTMIPDDPALFAGVETIVPLLLLQDTSAVTPALPPFLAREFASAIRDFASEPIQEATGEFRLCNIRITSPTLMALSDIELFESMIAKHTIAEFLNTYVDPERLIPFHLLLEGAIKGNPQISIDPMSIIYKEGVALRSRAMKSTGLKP
ncbi:hypothetical protein [Methylosinus sporium]|uniref:hypothetical protein n=1 Tax=Methylosinus sporium TaxID=428 RepID=UPI00383B564F